jgi:hypothetical protein
MSQLYCVKISQRRLSGTPFVYFPYDRIYLISKNDQHLIKKLFKYCFILPVTAEILTALGRLTIKQFRKIPCQKGQRLTNVGFSNILTEINESWLLVAPTYVKKVWDKTTQKIIKSSLDYIFTHALGNLRHNTSAKLPTIRLQTPTRDIPILCAICSSIGDFYANDCSPGQYSCKINADIQLEE